MPLYAVKIEVLDDDGNRTGQQANSVLSRTQLLRDDGLKPSVIEWLPDFADKEPTGAS